MLDESPLRPARLFAGATTMSHGVTAIASLSLYLLLVVLSPCKGENVRGVGGGLRYVHSGRREMYCLC